ncbi:hypothetical protein QJS04_geneDACA013469 [Acorus gramineus]|uniref:UDENN domain-containing protein n=1 Tax=Acorus gramineus TaxID=55184 RepID=A0AAV9AGN2_ACOGR|nr:hypothetical protein QJS04_geneDACA013469 [Acorus gramineus]
MSWMAKNDDTQSPKWTTSYFMQTTEDVARAVAAAAASATAARSQRPSVVFSSKDDSSNSPLQKLQRHVTRALKGFSPPPESKKGGAYNPEILTSQKRQWASFQTQTLDQRTVKSPFRLFESMVVVGLHPNTDVRVIERLITEKGSEGLKRSRVTLNCHDLAQAETSLEPQILFAYPPDKELPLTYNDLLSFCYPGGLEVHAVEKTPSMSELNEILLGQEHTKQSDLSFVFRLQVADETTLYGCCVLVEEIVQKPSGLISMLPKKQPSCSYFSRHIITTPRCYCILSRLPFFDLHFGVLRSIFAEERLERLTKGLDMLNFVPSEMNGDKHEESVDISIQHSLTNDVPVASNYSETETTSFPFPGTIVDDKSVSSSILLNGPEEPDKEGFDNNMSSKVISESEGLHNAVEHEDVMENSHAVEVSMTKEEIVHKQFHGDVLPLLQHQEYESSESSSSFQGYPRGDRNFNGDMEDVEVQEPSSSGREDSSDHNDILKWAEENNHNSLRIICDYYRLHSPARGSVLHFHPLEHLHPLEFHRPGETVLHIAGSTIDLRTFNTSLEVAEAHGALLAEEEATALSIWTVACICGSLRLENVLTLFAGALLEKQIVIVCSNLGILSASVLSIVPLIRPYQWQSLLMPVLPNCMLDFLDAPVPYIVGIKNKTAEVQSKLGNVILIDVQKNQVRSPTIPSLPQRKELLSSLSPYHAKLVGESYLARKRPIYECTDVQVEAAKGFLAVLRSYLDSLCSNLRSHTITNVQSNDDKVSLLLKESFIDSFPSRDRPFMKLFVDTQLFSVHTDLVLSFYQKE